MYIQRRKSWADQQGIRTGVWGEVLNGVTICEDNRATTWEFRQDGIELLRKILHENYLQKGVKAVLFGVDEDGHSAIKYAVFVRSGFLTPVSDVE